MAQDPQSKPKTTCGCTPKMFQRWVIGLSLYAMFHITYANATTWFAINAIGPAFCVVEFSQIVFGILQFIHSKNEQNQPL